MVSRNQSPSPGCENGEPPLPPDTVACLTIEGLQVIEEMLEEFRDAAGRPVSFDELCDAFRAAVRKPAMTLSIAPKKRSSKLS